MDGKITLYTEQGSLLPCFFHTSLPSTNDEAKRLAREGEGESFSVAAAEQTAGRGRMSRTFFSPRCGGLYLSFVCPAGERFARFGVLAALAVKELLYEYFRIPVSFKWPNDVLAEGKKIAGILPESIVTAKGDRVVVTGIGVNIFESADDFGALKDIATSACLCCKNEEIKREFVQDRQAFLHDAAVRLTELLARLYRLEQEGEDLLPDYKASLATLGRRVRFRDAEDVTRCGIAADTDADCALLVDTEEGRFSVGWGEVTELLAADADTSCGN